MMRRTAFVLALMLGCPAAVVAQAPDATAPAPGWAGEVAVLGANGLLGGLTAGIAGWARGESFADGFSRGFGGGTLVYAGKRIAADHRTGAGLIGRQVSSVGSSVVGNAASGRRSFDRVTFGLGPVRIYAGREVVGWMAWRLDAPAAAFAIWGALTPNLVFDGDESLSSGALVFRANDERMRFPGQDTTTGGFAMPGTIFYTRFSGDPERTSRVLAHERIHLLQYDQAFLSWSDPLEAWLSRLSPRTALLNQYLELNLVGLGPALLGNRLWDHHERPWEAEANYLAGT